MLIWTVYGGWIKVTTDFISLFCDHSKFWLADTNIPTLSTSFPRLLHLYPKRGHVESVSSRQAYLTAVGTYADEMPSVHSSP